MGARILRRRRNTHLSTKVFRPTNRLKSLLNTRQKMFLVLSVIVIGAGVGLVYFSGIFIVDEVIVERSSLELPIEEIEVKVRELALTRNIFQVDRGAIEDSIKKDYRDVASVKVNKDLPSTVRVTVVKFPIVAELRMGDERIFLNEKGYRVFDAAPDRDTLQLAAGEELDLGDTKQQIITPDQLKMIQNAALYFDHLTGIKVLNLKYFPIAREIHLKVDGNFDIWLDLTDDYQAQLEKLIQAGDALDLKEGKYEYIDLRIFGKIFYKEKE